MITQQFPDLQWLKRQIDSRFSNRRGPGNLQLDSDGFPSVLINARAKKVYRPDIAGPISIFLNLRGNSCCAVDGRTVTIDTDSYFISNRFQPYTLEIDNAAITETCNIHIGEYFSEQLLASVMNSSDTLLNQGRQLTVPTVAFHNKLYQRDAVFNALVQDIRCSQQAGVTDRLLFEEKLAALLLHLLQQHRNILQDIANMPPLKPAIKLELYKRLAVATDLIHASYTDTIALDEMAAAACLSKFHFLRLFKQAYHISPYQYLQKLRIEKAQYLLQHSAKTVGEIAAMLGFNNSNSFSRLFLQHTGVYPSQYRLHIN